MFTSLQQEYLFSAISLGYSRNQIRDTFRQTFGLGFSNATFTAARNIFSTAQKTAIRANSRNRETTTGLVPRNIPVDFDIYRAYRVTGLARVRFDDGSEKDLVISFNTSDNRLSELNNRVGNIVEQVAAQYGLDIDNLEVDYSLIYGTSG